jgi:hypothetical protein
MKPITKTPVAATPNVIGSIIMENAGCGWLLPSHGFSAGNRTIALRAISSAGIPPSRTGVLGGFPDT